MRHRITRAGCALVLLQILVSVCAAQPQDTSLVFAHTETSPSADDELHARLGGIASLGLGQFSTFDRIGNHLTMLQPTLGFDFLAEPGGSLHFLLGARLGFFDPLVAEASFGLRLPIHDDAEKSVKIYTDLALLFYADSNHAHPPGPGFRAALGARTSGSLDLEYRLAAEWRGQKSTPVDGNVTRNLWWIGAEVGIAFPIVSAYKSPTRKDSLRASLRYIATGEEITELDGISSRIKLDEWLDHFWKRRDLTPDTYTNEARIEFERRVRLANDKFSHPKRMGVVTDAGRVLVIYGNPDDTEGATSSANDGYRYELWVYRHRIATQPLAVFLFRTNGPREMVQVYSNVPGELSGSIPPGLPMTMMRWIQ